ncbi:PAS domain-containing sensor histidine kinase [Bacillus sp. REN10]|uniref:PAS domain-containing sensor histidine kinase n=1 Tax=Bacillus sp. REN10 TaxID=2782541 RepID=UPI00193AE4EA|nr:PAS domain-containing sensor histidine kinase [Bacillus sp. REN10]
MKWYKSYIFWKIFLINLAVIFTVLFFVFTASRILLPDITQDLYREVTDRNAKRIKEKISVVAEDMKTLAVHVQSREELQSSDPDVLYKELGMLSEVSSFIDSALIVDKEGNVQVYFPKEEHSPPKSVKDEVYFQRPLETKQPYVSDVLNMPSHGPVLVFSVPILADGEVSRIITLTLWIKENRNFQTIFQTYKFGYEKTGSAFIVDHQGRVISHPDVTQIGKDMSNHPAVQKLKKHESGDIGAIKQKDLDYFASFEYVPLMDWGVVMEVPKEDVYYQYHLFMKALFIMSLFVVVILSVLTALYAQDLVKPIRRLYTAVDLVAKGDDRQRISTIVKGEIGVLSTRFNEMVEHMRTSKLNLQRKEEELQRQKDFFRTVIDMNPSYIYAVDREGYFTFVNQSFASFLGREVADFEGKKVSDFSFRQKQEVGQEHSFTREMFINSKGEMRHVETAHLPIFSALNHLEQTLYVSTDITERIQAEEWIRTSEKLTIVGELAAGVAHEIRNPLTSIKGFVQLMKEDSQQKQPYLEVVDSEIDRISMIVNEFLVLGKPQAMKFQPTNMNKLIQDVIILLAAQANMNGVEIKSEFSHSLPITYCDQNQMKQVFINILKNAIEAMPNGGQVHIKTKLIGNEMVLTFQDEGTGISKERLAKIGEPFYSTKEKGTGLGLMVSYRIIEAHHAQMNITSEVGRGTLVEVTFPLSTSKA